MMSHNDPSYIGWKWKSFKMYFFIVFYPQVDDKLNSLISKSWQQDGRRSHLQPVGHDNDRGIGDGAEQLFGGSLLLFSVVFLLHLQGTQTDGQQFALLHMLNFSLNQIYQAGITLFLLSLYLIIMYFAHAVMWWHWCTIKRNSKDLCHIDFPFKQYTTASNGTLSTQEYF